MALAASADIRFTTSLGAAAWVKNNTHVEPSMAGPPASAIVGTSAAPGTRLLENTAIALIFPLRTCGIMMPHVRSGKIKAMAVFSNKRVPGAAEVPTIAEAGGPAIEGSTWVLFLTQAAAPKDVVNRMSAEAAKAINSPEMRAKFESLGIESVGSTPDQAGKFLDEEIVKWAKVISAAGVKAE